MIERALVKLGAFHDCLHASDAWLLKRLGSHIFWEGGDLCDGDKWLLIGEITEALRENGCYSFKQYPNRMTLPELYICQGGTGRHAYEADSLLDCYIQAADELLQPAEEGKE